MNTAEYGEVILSRYNGDSKLIPALNEVETDAVIEYMQSEELVMFAGLVGAIDRSGHRISVESLINTQDAGGALDRVPHAIIGPHIMGGKYMSNGIGLWAPKIETFRAEDSVN